MKFWIRNAILGAVLGLLAYLFFVNQDFLTSLDGSMGQVSTIDPVTIKADDFASTETVEKAPKVVKEKKKKNAAAEGLSNFYANIYGDMDDKGPKIRNNVIYLPDPKGDLIQILDARKMVVRPYKQNWRGSTKSRPFRKGDTLYQKLAEFSAKEKLEILWWINRDFIVKDPFRVNENIVRTTYKVSKAVEGHFENGLSVYFCYSHRAMVVIDDVMDYLDENCTLMKSKNGY